MSMNSFLIVRSIYITLNILLVFGTVTAAIFANTYDGLLSVGQLFFSVVTLITTLGLGFCVNTKKVSYILCIYIAIISVLLAVDLIFAVVFHATNPIWMGYAILQSQWDSPVHGDSRMNVFQAEHKCCGFYGPDDFPKYKMNTKLSCYPKGHEGEADYLYKEGCVYKIQGNVIKYLQTMAVISWCSFFIKIAIVVCAFIMVMAFIKMEKDAVKV